MRRTLRRRLLVGGILAGLCVLAALPAFAGADSTIAVTGVTQTGFQLCPDGAPGTFDPGFVPPPSDCMFGSDRGQTFPVTFCPDADVHVWVASNIADAEPKVSPDPTGAGIEDGYLQVTVTGANTNIVQRVFVPYTRPDPSAPEGSFDIGTLPPGTYTVTAAFLGSQFDFFLQGGGTATLTELPSEATGTLTILPACLGSAAFVVGDGSARPGAAVTFWGSRWAKANTLSHGPGASSFKGWANSVTAGHPMCGGTWSSGTGNSSQPPATIGPYVAVVVTGEATQHGSTVSGTVEHVVIVRTDPGYDASPGRPGTGVVVGQLC